MKSWIEDDNICYDYIIRYLRDIIPQTGGQLAEMESYAKENSVPISQPESRTVFTPIPLRSAT